MAPSLQQLLKTMVDNGASDLHVTRGSPPQIRLDGHLVKLKTDPLTGDDTKALCYSIMTDAQKAQKAVDLVMTWQQLNKAWKDWGHCDSGEVGDIFTDALLRLMVDWKDTGTLAEAMKDESYKAFITSHLKSPVAQPDRAAVYSRAANMCPKGQAAFCKEIEDAVSDKPAAAPAPAAAAAAPATSPPATTK